MLTKPARHTTNDIANGIVPIAFIQYLEAFYDVRRDRRFRIDPILLTIRLPMYCTFSIGIYNTNRISAIVKRSSTLPKLFSNRRQCIWRQVYIIGGKEHRIDRK